MQVGLGKHLKEMTELPQSRQLSDSDSCVLKWFHQSSFMFVLCTQNMEEEVQLKRDELNRLRQEELNLELKVEAGHNKLVQLVKMLHGSQMTLEQVRSPLFCIYTVFNPLDAKLFFTKLR